MTVRAGRGWAKEASTEARRTITTESVGDKIFPLAAEFASAARPNPANIPPPASRAGHPPATPRHVHPPNPASWLPVDTHGGSPADFEMQSPPRLAPSIVPRAPTAATAIVLIWARNQIRSVPPLCPPLVLEARLPFNDLYYPLSIKHWPLNPGPAVHPCLSRVLVTCLAGRRPLIHPLSFPPLILRHAFYVHLLSNFRPLTRTLQDQPQC